MATQPDGTEDVLAQAVGAVDDEALRAMMREEVGRLDPAARAVVVRRLRGAGGTPSEGGAARHRGRATGGRGGAGAAGAEGAPVCRRVRLRGRFFGFWYGMVFGAPHHSERAGQVSAFWQIARYAWAALLTWMLVRDLRGGRLQAAWAVARRVTPWVLVQNVFVIAVTVAVALTLLHVFPPWTAPGCTSCQAQATTRGTWRWCRCRSSISASPSCSCWPSAS